MEASSAIDISRDWQLAPKDDNVLILSHWHFWELAPKGGQPVTAAPAFNVLEQPGVRFRQGGHGYCRFYAKGNPGPTFLVYETSAWTGACRIDIGPFLKRGTGVQMNVVEIHFGEEGLLLEPFRLYGDFKVSFPHAGFPPGRLDYKPAQGSLRELDSWDDIGYPHFAGTMLYKKEVALSEEWLAGAETVWPYAEEINDVARLVVNGEEQGNVLCEPFAWEILSVLQAGINRIGIEAANSPVALFEGGRKRAGIRGRVLLLKR
ncbi:hypothetical protein [Paenibacillus sp. MBLB4367]|uniref:hypothetical protein n=1 Tax=Paenibacillus sp. MBLB4367 TaxID=3384767 RepID=UPI003907FAAB